MNHLFAMSLLFMGGCSMRALYPAMGAVVGGAAVVVVSTVVVVDVDVVDVVDVVVVLAGGSVSATIL